MRTVCKKSMFALFAAAVAFLMIAPATAVSTDGAAGDVVFKDNFGDSVGNVFESVIAASDGYVAVGYANYECFGVGDWLGVSGRGITDSIIVKYDVNGKVEWKKNFGGSKEDSFYDVTAAPDGGYVAVGGSFVSGGDWATHGVTGKGDSDATIVKFNSDGKVAWAKNFGGTSADGFSSVTTVSDGYIAVGSSYKFDGDWIGKGVIGKGHYDATIVKFNFDGSVAWAKNFGGSYFDEFTSVTAVSDGFVAVGNADGPFDQDWAANGVSWKGAGDATIVKFNNNGSVAWAKSFGGIGHEYFLDVAEISGGYVAVGRSFCIGGDWTVAGITGMGSNDAVTVKFSYNGTVAWAKNFGGIGSDGFESIVKVTGGFVAAGYSSSESFGNGDWIGIEKRGITTDAIIVMFKNNGSVEWKKNFGGTGQNIFSSVTVASDGYVVAGSAGIFGGDWADSLKKGGFDATIVKFDTDLISVMDIKVPSSVIVEKGLTLPITVEPSNATNKTITWEIKDAGETGAAIIDGVLSNTAIGTMVITATVADGTAAGDFVKDFTITVKEPPSESSSLLWIGLVAVIAIILIGAAIFLIKKAPKKTP